MISSMVLLSLKTGMTTESLMRDIVQAGGKRDNWWICPAHQDDYNLPEYGERILRGVWLPEAVEL